MSSLTSTPVREVLSRIESADEANKPAASARLRAAGTGLAPPEIAAIFRDAPLAVSAREGEFLYALARGCGARLIVEYGMSFAASSIYLAAALRDDGGRGRLVTTEIDAEKARTGRSNLEDAGLAALVEVRVGDAMETLRDLAGPVDLLFLDGLDALYLPVLRLLEPQLRPGALVVADRSVGDRKWPAYRAYVRDPANRYFSLEVPLGDGLELSVVS